MKYALIKDGNVVNVIEAEADFATTLEGYDAVVESGDAGIGWGWDGEVFTPPDTQEPPPPPPSSTSRLRKISFFDRFPKAENGVSTKYDLLSFFMSSDEYADSLGVTGEQRIALRLLITTGLNRINASMFVDLTPNQDGSPTDAAKFVGLLMQPMIPQAFRLGPADAQAILNPELLPGEEWLP